ARTRLQRQGLALGWRRCRGYLAITILSSRVTTRAGSRPGERSGWSSIATCAARRRCAPSQASSKRACTDRVAGAGLAAICLCEPTKLAPSRLSFAGKILTLRTMPKASPKTEAKPAAKPVAAKAAGKGDHVFLVDGSSYIFRAYHALP